MVSLCVAEGDDIIGQAKDTLIPGGLLSEPLDDSHHMGIYNIIEPQMLHSPLHCCLSLSVARTTSVFNALTFDSVADYPLLFVPGVCRRAASLVS
jgi:hypothetical protein